jgi:hypothetical protein
MKVTPLYFLHTVSVSIALSVRRGVRKFLFVEILIALSAFLRFHGNQM